MLDNLPRTTRYLLLANLVMWLLDECLQRYGIQLTYLFGLRYWSSSGFHIWQPMTYMFMHGGFRHLFFNMFALLVFGPALEREWGERKFLLYYLVCGLGAALVQETVWSIQLQALAGQYSANQLTVYTSQMVTIGASGAVFGILFAFGWLFPDVPMFLFFIPIPIRARTMVIIYAVIELAEGFSSIPGDNVAHFAHLGGMLFGWLLLLYWRRRTGREGLSGLFSFFTRKGHQRTDKEKKSKFTDYHYQRNLNE